MFLFPRHRDLWEESGPQAWTRATSGKTISKTTIICCRILDQRFGKICSIQILLFCFTEDVHRLFPALKNEREKFWSTLEHSRLSYEVGDRRWFIRWHSCFTTNTILTSRYNMYWINIIFCEDFSDMRFERQTEPPIKIPGIFPHLKDEQQYSKIFKSNIKNIGSSEVILRHPTFIQSPLKQPQEKFPGQKQR